MAIHVWIFLLICVNWCCARHGVNIADKCEKQYDLDYRLTGFNCESLNARLFYYVGDPVDSIKFQLLPPAWPGAKVFIDSAVKNVIVSDRDMDECTQIIAQTTVVINDRDCDFV